MSVKTLRKQLFAAIAMVLVAAVALGSSTYAWFVSNNKVTATTTSISAQSNAPFLKIQDTATGITKNSGTAYAYTTPATATALYPAQFDGTKWESAYAEAATTATEKSGTRFTVGASGTHSEATTNNYAFMQSFAIGTDSETNGSFTNLRVDSINVTGVDGAGTPEATDKKQIIKALRVLFVCGDNHFVYAQNSAGNAWELVDTYFDNTNSTGNTALTEGKAVLKSTIAAKGTGNATVDVYLFYDGSQTEVYSNNLPNLGSANIAVTFIADAFDPNGISVDPGSQIN